MPKKLVKQITEELLREPVEVVKEAGKQVGVVSEVEEQPKERKLSQEEITKRRAKAARILRAHQVELRDIQQLPKQITGKPEFPQKKKKKEPLPLVAAKRPIGTKERLKGILG